MSLTYSKSNLVDFSSVLGQHLGVKVWRKHTYCSKRKNCFMSKSYQKPISGNLQQDKSWNAEHYRKSYSFVGKLGAPVLELLQPLKGERILDLGCGEGCLSKELEHVGCSVVGVDSSPEMVELAKRDGLTAFVMDGQDLTFETEFDAVFSNAALHWMSQNPRKVVSGVKTALVPGGRFVAEMGGFGNCAAIITAIIAVLKKRNIDASSRIPWFFPTVEEYREILELEGFQVENIELIPRPTALEAGMADWYNMFGDFFFVGMTKDEKKEAIAEAVELLKSTLLSKKGQWFADYVRLRFICRLKNEMD